MERILVAALHHETPAERLRELVAAADERLDADDRRRLASIDADGLRVMSLIVRKLRFERLLAGDANLRAAYDRDPTSFAVTFRRYAAAVPPTAAFPVEEARLFGAWDRRDVASCD